MRSGGVPVVKWTPSTTESVLNRILSRPIFRTAASSPLSTRIGPLRRPVRVRIHRIRSNSLVMGLASASEGGAKPVEFPAIGMVRRVALVASDDESLGERGSAHRASRFVIQLFLERRDDDIGGRLEIEQVENLIGHARQGLDLVRIDGSHAGAQRKVIGSEAPEEVPSAIDLEQQAADRGQESKPDVLLVRAPHLEPAVELRVSDLDVPQSDLLEERAP